MVFIGTSLVNTESVSLGLSGSLLIPVNVMVNFIVHFVYCDTCASLYSRLQNTFPIIRFGEFQRKDFPWTKMTRGVYSNMFGKTLYAASGNMQAAKI